MKKEELIEKVDLIVGQTGTSADKVITILQQIQEAFHYLPVEALERVCAMTDISLSQIQGISTFYSQFRHELAGKHMIRVCTGTACHVKGALQVYDAFRRELKLAPGENTDRSAIFSVEKVACLGCCTLAPVVRIDDVTYGHVTPGRAGEILVDFLKRPRHAKPPANNTGRNKENVQGEIRIGLGSCCIASGSAEVKAELEQTIADSGILVDVKQVGCVGICNQVPVMEILS